ncbi:unnamed protein product [Aspergillus niger]|uniref:Contig An18c0010, genomic contig n=1 Tax=Aspergillus niger (strain ATCC MYA-4892 / CBS 513.88 / FGSC A1513) TaxID=425011 RepID=A2R9T7_ASPNC|nr:unnamed protein product [Aspergillus niger]
MVNRRLRVRIRISGRAVLRTNIFNKV